MCVYVYTHIYMCVYKYILIVPCMINEKWGYDFERGEEKGNRRMWSKERGGVNDVIKLLSQNRNEKFFE